MHRDHEQLRLKIVAGTAALSKHWAYGDECMAGRYGDDGRPPAGRAASRRVLVVDDDHDSAEALAELLALNGHDVRIATGAEQALAIFPEARPQVAVLDIGLPFMDGYELQARMRDLPGGGDCIYLALTGYDMSKERDQVGEGRFQAHLVKPVDLDELLGLIAATTGDLP
jgi:CheY-like chemotaxis protein